MKIDFLEISILEKSIRCIFIIVMILLARRRLNLDGIKNGNYILWGILFAYLLVPFSVTIVIKQEPRNIILASMIKLPLLYREWVRNIVKACGYILSRYNQLVVSGFMFGYLLIQIRRRNEALKDSIELKTDTRMNECINSFNLRRKVSVFVNDKISTPITYGICKPKIIIQSYICEDDELLKHVLMHEMTHIKRFDLLVTHIKNIIACLYWHNVLILYATKISENDLEVFCDKSVVQKMGDTVCNRKNYCTSMLKITERKKNIPNVVLKLHPTTERIMILKNWKKTTRGFLLLILLIALSGMAFFDVRAWQKDVVISTTQPMEDNVIDNDRVEEISAVEYSKLILAEKAQIRLRSADIDDQVTLDRFEHKSYKWDRISWKESNHNGFTIKISDIYSKGEIDYRILITEDGEVMYKSNFNDAIMLKIKANYNSFYEVIAFNESNKPLSCRVKIDSYIR